MVDLVEWARFVLATVFLLAGVAKLGDREAFASAVKGYGLVAPAVAEVVAAVLPPLEVAAAALLLLGVQVRAVAALLAVLLAGFAFAVAANLARGRRISCGCLGGNVERELTWWTVARNLGLITLAVLVAAQPGEPAGTTAAMLVAGSLTVVAALLVATGFRVACAARRIEGSSR